MTKIRLTIYLIIFLILLFGLIFVIFGLTKKNNQNNSNIIPTPTQTLLIEITWPEAVNLVQSCQIKTVFQKRNLEITLTSKDNRVFKTKEPNFNDIFTETNHLRSDCNDIIQTITE